MSMIGQVIFRRSSWKIIPFLISSSAFVIAGVFILIRSPEKWIGWMTVFFFGGCTVTFVYQLLDSRPRLIIDERGVFDRTLGVGIIPWSEIVDAFPMTIRSSSFVCLVLRRPEIYMRRLPPRRQALAHLNQQLGFTDFSVNLTGLAIDPAEICELILKRASLESEHID